MESVAAIATDSPSVDGFIYIIAAEGCCDITVVLNNIELITSYFIIQMNKGPGPFGEDNDLSTEDKGFPPDVSHPPESDRAKRDKEGETPFPREPYSRCV